MTGKIIKGIAGIYYVQAADGDEYVCSAKGIFRNRRITPLVGDDTEIDIISSEEKTGNLIRILSRKTELIRPAVANVDQALVMFAAAEPEPNFNLLDRFLIMMQKQRVDTIICFNKKDKVDVGELKLIEEIYEKCGHHLMFISAVNQDGIDMIREILRGKTTVLAGPSGVGKSTLMNAIQPKAGMETGVISQKVKRGKHTTRHSELIYVEKDTYLMDTPGFSSLYVSDITRDELKSYFIEFDEYNNECRFLGCNHIKEPVCGVKKALGENRISRNRYNNYVLLYKELADYEANKQRFSYAEMRKK